jgi:hypothetical protein
MTYLKVDPSVVPKLVLAVCLGDQLLNKRSVVMMASARRIVADFFAVSADFCITAEAHIFARANLQSDDGSGA